MRKAAIPAGRRCASGPAGAGDDVNIEAFLANDVSLREHLSAQVPLVLKEPVERLIGQYLVDMVDEAGYLPGADLAAIADKLGAAAGDRSRRCLPRCRRSIRRASSPARSPNAWRCN